jgi:parallel beta-helix repeat protein
VCSNLAYKGKYSWQLRLLLRLENDEVGYRSAHGKFIWDKYSTYVENTGEENPLIGRDSLGIRKLALNVKNHLEEILGPYCCLDVDDGSASIYYTPDESGDFAFYTNPNSNWSVDSDDEDYAQSIVSGFCMKNLRTDNGEIKADFYVNEIIIPNSMILTKGKWYFYGNLTIPSGKTLTILPGTTLQFRKGKSLVVSGSLNAIGTSNNKITLDFVNKGGGNGIKFNYGSTGTLNYCNINNAYYGVYISSNNATLSIQFCNISDNNYGIYYSLDAYIDNTISNNTIENNTHDGIYMDCAGQPESISNNTIRYNGR